MFSLFQCMKREVRRRISGARAKCQVDRTNIDEIINENRWVYIVVGFVD